MKDIDLDKLVNLFLAEWKSNKDKSTLRIKLTLQEHIEVLRLIEKMRE